MGAGANRNDIIVIPAVPGHFPAISQLSSQNLLLASSFPFPAPRFLFIHPMDKSKEEEKRFSFLSPSFFLPFSFIFPSFRPCIWANSNPTEIPGF